MADIWQTALRGVKKSHVLEKVYAAAIINQFPIAVWRMPESPVKQAVVDLSGSLETTPVDFKNLPAGFSISPFENAGNRGPLFIKANLHLRDSECRFTHAGDNSTLLLENKEKLERTIFDFRANGVEAAALKAPWFVHSRSEIDFKEPLKPEYCELVEKAVQEIHSGNFQKVVLSRLLEVKLAETFHPLVMFDALCEAYPTAFVSLVALPGIGTWIGATPELLFSLKNDEFLTVSLAGTRPVAPGNNGWARTWGEKEIVEQEIVSEFIRDCFKKLGIDNYSEQPVRTVQIGNLLHLQTEFKAPHISEFGKKTVERLLGSLHPTPAVCGVPQKFAREFIKNEEFHDREFYTGFLGPVNLQNQSQLFVNLRCLQLLQNSALVYVGGGITFDSNPEQEWLETELKLEALLKFVFGNHHSASLQQQAKAI